MSDENAKQEGVEMAQVAANENGNQVVPAENGASGGEKGEYVPDQFSNKAEYVLSCIGFAVGFGNVWRFPYMCYSSGGAAFLIPYFFCFFLIAVPFFLVETAYGQLVEMRLHARWGAIVPKMWGMKIVQVFICFATCIYYITLMAWSLTFFWESWKSPLPWAAKAVAANASEADKKAYVDMLWTAPEKFFEEQVQSKSKDITVQGGMVGHLVVSMFFAYVCVYFCAWKGLKSTGKMVWVTCLLPYVIITILLIKALTLNGCGEGLKYLFIPDWSKVADGAIWKNAAIQILFSSGVAYGPFLYYGSARKKSDTIVKASFWIPLANSATSIYAALCIFAFLGHVQWSNNDLVGAINADGTFDEQHEKYFAIKDVATSGPHLLFVAFPALINQLDGANFWAVIFFIMCICLGIDSVFGFFDYYIQMSEDAFPVLKTKMRKEIQVLIITIFSFIWSLMFVVEGGAQNFDMFDGNAGHLQLLFALFAQTIFIPWIVGMDVLSQLIYWHTGEFVPKFYVFVIRVICPLFILFILIVGIINEFADTCGRIDCYPTEAGKKKVSDNNAEYDRINNQNKAALKKDPNASQADLPDKLSHGKYYTQGILWGARMIWLLPLVILVLLMFIPLKNQESFFECVEKQYGVRFKRTKLKWWEYLIKNQSDDYDIVDQATFDALTTNAKNAAGGGDVEAPAVAPEQEAEPTKNDMP